MQLWLGQPPRWHRVGKWSRAAAELADEHYSRQTPGSDQVLPPGQTLLMLTPCDRAVWGVVCNLDPVGAVRWRNSLFRNVGGGAFELADPRRDGGDLRGMATPLRRAA